MAEKGKTSCDDTGQIIDVDGLIGNMELLGFENSNNKTNLSTSEAVNDNISVVVPSLLPEIIADILSRLPIEDIVRYKTVSKEWYALTKDPYFAEMHLRKSLCLAHRLILVPKVENSYVETNLCLLNSEDGIWRGRNIPIENMAGKFRSMVCSCHGFLCVASPKEDPLLIYNPVLRECVELPKTNIDVGETYITVGFGYDPIKKKYKVVRFFTFLSEDRVQTQMKAEIIALGEPSWRELEVPCIHFCNPNSEALFFDDALHWVIDKDGDRSCDKILILDPSSEKFRTITILSCVRRSIQFPYEVSLVNLGGCLALMEQAYWEKLHIWRIKRANTKTGYRFYEAFYHLTTAHKNFIWSMKLKDKLIDDSLLFHVSCFTTASLEEKTDHLALYYPERAEYQIIDALGIPKVFESTFFVPSLVSPGAAPRQNASMTSQPAQGAENVGRRVPQKQRPVRWLEVVQNRDVGQSLSMQGAQQNVTQYPTNGVESEVIMGTIQEVVIAGSEDLRLTQGDNTVNAVDKGVNTEQVISQEENIENLQKTNEPSPSAQSTDRSDGSLTDKPEIIANTKVGTYLQVPKPAQSNVNLEQSLRLIIETVPIISFLEKTSASSENVKQAMKTCTELTSLGVNSVQNLEPVQDNDTIQTQGVNVTHKSIGAATQNSAPTQRDQICKATTGNKDSTLEGDQNLNLKNLQDASSVKGAKIHKHITSCVQDMLLCRNRNKTQTAAVDINDDAVVSWQNSPAKATCADGAMTTGAKGNDKGDDTAVIGSKGNDKGDDTTQAGVVNGGGV